MSPFGGMVFAGPSQAQFNFQPNIEGLTPQTVISRFMRMDLTQRGPQPVEIGGKVVAYIVTPEDIDLLDKVEDYLANKAVEKAYRDQGDIPFTDFNAFMKELGVS